MSRERVRNAGSLTGVMITSGLFRKFQSSKHPATRKNNSFYDRLLQNPCPYSRRETRQLNVKTREKLAFSRTNIANPLPSAPAR
jgi:hypothetical protein